MNTLKRAAGFLWMVVAIGAIWFLLSRGIHELSAAKVTPDKKIFWWSILPVYIPLMLGLILFGWYAWKGEYDELEVE